MDKIILDECGKHGAALTIDHIVAALSFGFWVHLLTKNFDHILWKGGLRPYFPHLPAGEGRADLHDRLDQLRTFRNRIAHHYAIFDRKPMAEYQNLLEIAGAICADTLWLTRQLSHVPRAINARPRF